MGILSAESHYCLSSLLLLSLVLAISPCAGFAVQCIDEGIRQGDRVMVHLAGIGDGSTFSIAMEGRFVSGNDASFRLGISGFSLPILLSEGSIQASAWNTAGMKFDARKGATTVSVSGESGGGEILIRESQDLGAGIYEILKIEGTALERGGEVRTAIQFTGTKSGPDKFDIEFTVDELTEGELRVTVYIDRIEVMNNRLVLVTAGSVESRAGILPHCFGKRWLSMRSGRADAFAVKGIREMSAGLTEASLEISAPAMVHSGMNPAHQTPLVVHIAILAISIAALVRYRGKLSR